MAAETSTILSHFVTVKKQVEKLHSGWTWKTSAIPSGAAGAINTALAQFISPVCFKHTVKRTNDVKLFVDGEDVGTLANPNVKKLLKLATPAPFGKGNETVLDTTVRKAFQIDGKRIIYQGDIISDYPPANWGKVGPVGRHIVAKLYKLHIYPPGGHFKEHVDTQHGKDHFMSAIVIAGTPHTGGDLIIGTGREETRVTQSSEPNICNAAAWFTDVIHRVEPVLTGHRIVLQYDFCTAPVDSDDDNNRNDESGDEPTFEKINEFEEDGFQDDSNLFEDENVVDKLPTSDPKHLVNLVCNYLKEESPKNVAFLLRHQYLDDSLDRYHLKGTDFAIYKTFERHGEIVCTFRLSLEHVILTKSLGENNGFNIDKDSIMVGPLRLSERGETWPLQDTDVFVGARTFGERVQILDRLDYVEHTGNEAQIGHVKYHFAALVVSLVPRVVTAAKRPNEDAAEGARDAKKQRKE